jgi:hypothetical protein
VWVTGLLDDLKTMLACQKPRSKFVFDLSGRSTAEFHRQQFRRPRPLSHHRLPDFGGLLRSSHRLPIIDFWEDATRYQCKKCPILLVPGERIELPTNGLQNRCSTAELTRQGPIYGHF